MKDLKLHRNIGISAHIDSGKTTLTERILYYSGRIHKMGDVKKEGAVMDHMELEKEKGITITSAATSVGWKNDKIGEEYSVNVIDTPGHVDFTVEVERSLRVLDGAILVLCAVGGVQSQSLTVDRQMKRYQTPRIAFINKMDRTGADPDDVTRQIEEKLGTTPVRLQIAIGKEDEFEGVVDLLTMEAVRFEGDQGENVVRGEIPADLLDEAKAARAETLETLSMYSDDLMEKLLEEEDNFDPAELRKIIREATLAQEITPVLMGTAFKNKGVQECLDAVGYYLPCPLDRQMQATDWDQSTEEDMVRVDLKTDDELPTVAMAFKTVVEQYGQLTYTRIYQGTLKKGETYINTRTGKKVRFGRMVRMHANDREDIEEAGAGDIIAIVGIDCASGDTFTSGDLNYSLENIFVPDAVITRSVEPLSRDGADKLAKALERFRREDPTFRVMSDEETGQTLIAGMGQLHLEVYIERIRREYGVECEVGQPRVAYRECPTQRYEFNYKHKKQTGGSGQYAHMVGYIEPMEEDADEPYEFVNGIVQGKIPREYIPAIDNGFQTALVKGPLSECEVVGVRAVVNDGSYHDVDSSEMAFKIAAGACMREALMKSEPALQEPIMKLEIEVPEEFQGPVTGHVSGKRGMITGSTVRNGVSVIYAEVPLASMFDYANELRSATQGKGSFSMEFSHYKVLPRSLQEEVIKKRAEDKEARLAMS